MERKIPTTFSAEVVGDISPVTNEISKARLGIFYRGANRNGSFITDEFADQLVKTLPYAPVVGIYDKAAGEFQGHSINPNDANMYGVVPENPNFAWETRVDPDGVTREYATTDVYLYTGRYDAAKKIVGNAQSMELDPNSISGTWRVVNGEYFFSYTEGCFLGLSVLGPKFEPCFEGSSFFELVKNFNQFMVNKNNNNGGSQMNTGDNQILGAQVTEPVVEPAAEPTVEPATEPTVEPSAEPTPAVEPEPATEPTEPAAEPVADPEPAPATEPTEPTDPVEPTPEPAEPTEPAEPEFSKEKLHALQEFEAKVGPIETAIELFESNNSKIAEMDSKILDFTSQIDTLTSEANELRSKYAAIEAEQKAALTAEKVALCDKYSTVVTADAMEEIKKNLDSFSLKELEKELLFAGKDTFFSLPEGNLTSFNNLGGDSDLDPVEKVLSKYSK